MAAFKYIRWIYGSIEDGKIAAKNEKSASDPSRLYALNTSTLELINSVDVAMMGSNENACATCGA